MTMSKVQSNRYFAKKAIIDNKRPYKTTKVHYKCRVRSNKATYGRQKIIIFIRYQLEPEERKGRPNPNALQYFELGVVYTVIF